MNPQTKAIPVVNFVPNPTLTSVTPTGGAAGSYTYKIVGVAADGTKTAASAAVTDAAGPTTLDGTHYEDLVWTDPLNAVSIEIWRTAGGASQGKVGTVAAGVQTFRDTGIVAVAGTPSAANTTGIGTPVDVSGLSDLTVEVDGTFVATLQVQGEIDGGSGTFVNIGSALNAAGFLDVSVTAKALSQLRVKMTAYTSGTAKVEVAGH